MGKSYELNDFLEEDFGYRQKLSFLPPKFRFIDYLFWLFIFVLLFWSLKLFLVDYSKLFPLAEGNYYYKILFYPPRGNILSADGKILATSIKSYDLLIDLVILRQSKEIFEETIDFLKKIKIIDNYLTEEEIRKNLTEKNQIVLRNIEIKDALLIKNRNLPSLIVIDSFKRFYPEKETLAHILGTLTFENNNFSGSTGIEKIYNDYLIGISGYKKYLRTSEGKIIKELEKKDPQEGFTLVTTINFKLQKIVYEEFSKYLDEIQRKKGAAVFLDKEGRVLSLVSLPSFDNNLFTSFYHSPEEKEKIKKILTDSNSPLFNRAVSGLYSPGSIVKPIVALAGLEMNKIDPQTQIFSSGELKIKGPNGKIFIFRDWKVHGWTNLYKAIKDSVNIYFYKLGELIGYENLINWYHQVKLEEPTGIDISGEKNGYLPQKSQYFLGDIYNISIGQGEILITPLKMALLAQLLGLNEIKKPYIVERIIDNEGKIIFQQRNDYLLKNFFDEEKIKIIQNALRGVVSEGMARKLENIPLKIAGKTGTPEMGTKVNGIFIGYFPADNPQIFFSLLLEDAPNMSLDAVEAIFRILNRAVKENVF